MRSTAKKSVLIGSVSMVLLVSAVVLAEKPAAKPAMPKIPGITAPDTHPNACVDCHVNHPEMKFDGRLSTIVGGFTKQVDDKTLAKAKAAALDPSKIKGKHPVVEAAFKDIPNACLKCHKRDSKMAPPFAHLMHAIHLAGGQENHFITMYQGECTQCHKLDQKSGAWSFPSSPEK